MIMTPTLVFPDDEVVKIDKHKSDGEYDRAPLFSYQFNCTAGSAMRWALCTYTNLKTGEQNYSYFPKGGDINTFYNGDTVRVNEVVFNDIANNGHDYMYQYTLFQTDPTTIAADTTYGDGTGLYDMYFCRGKILTADNSTHFYIHKEIGNLRSAYYYTRSDGSVYLVGGAYMEIGEERRLIEKYNYSTGEVTLKNGFSTKPEVGAVYRIFTNYFIDRPHYVKCRDNPTCNLTAEIVNDTRLHCSCTYLHPNHVGLKYYKYYLYQTTGSSSALVDGVINEIVGSTSINIGSGISDDIVGKYIMIESEPTTESGHVVEGYSCYITSYNITSGVANLAYSASSISVGSRYTIYEGNQILVGESPEIYDFNLDYSFYVNYAGNSFKVVCEIMTLDDKMYQYNIAKSFSSHGLTNNDGTCKVADFTATMLNNDTVYLTWRRNNLVINNVNITTCRVFRRNINEDKYVFLGTSSSNSFFDVTAGNGQNYIYYLCYSNFKAYVSPTVTTNWIGWDIYSLNDESNTFNRHRYSIGKHWHFIADIQDNDITSNIGLTVHTGTGIKPKTTRTVTDYESGSFTADLLTLSCPDGEIVDNIDRVKEWTRFIKGQNDFMLKSDKGDVWIINISDSPTRVYDSTSVYGLTSITYNWIEVQDVNDVIINR